MEMKGASRSVDDLLGVLALSLLSLAVTLTDQGSLMRSLLGLPFVLLLPGYALLEAIHSNSSELDVSERLSLSCALSMATVILVAIGLNVFHRLDQPGLVFVLEAIIVAACAHACRRRAKASSEGIGCLVSFCLRPESQSMLVTVLEFMVIGCVCITLYLAADVIDLEQAPRPTTALYLLGEEDKAGGYTRAVVCGSRFPVTVGIINNERIVRDYSIWIRTGEEAARILTQVTLDPGQTWEKRFEIPTGPCDTVQYVRFDLLAGESEYAHRSVFQRVSVGSGHRSDGIREESMVRSSRQISEVTTE